MTGAAAGDVSEDALLGGRVRLLQPRHGYRAAIDPVLLAAAVPAKVGERVLELGCGAGAAALCLAARVPGVQVVGLEVQSGLADLARRSTALNGVEGRVAIAAGDLLAPPAAVTEAPFDHVMANPPHLAADAATAPPDPAKAQAQVEGAARLADWVGTAVRLVRPKGSVTLVHRADRLDDLLVALRDAGAGGLAVLPLWPSAGAPAKRVIVQARRGVRAPLRLLAGLVLHADGGYTPAADAVLRDAAALPL